MSQEQSAEGNENVTRMTKEKAGKGNIVRDDKVLKLGSRGPVFKTRSEKRKWCRDDKGQSLKMTTMARENFSKVTKQRTGCE